MNIGDTVQYYSPTDYTMKSGVVTAIDVPVEHLYQWAEHGTIMQSRHYTAGAVHPLGVEIDRSITRPYYGDDKTRIAA